MTDVARIGLVGAGMMGANHARVLSFLKNVDFIGVFDPDLTRAESVTSRFGGRVFGSLDDLSAAVDAVSLCSPSSTHGEIGEILLLRGIHVLVEKPLATSREECDRLLDARDSTGARLAVGHVERFNPVVKQLAGILAGGTRVYSASARRMSSVSSRITDVDVVLDLMVHDVDVLLTLLGTEVDLCVAEGLSVDGLGCDYAHALMRMGPNRSIATLTASRITQNKVRDLQLTTDFGYIKADYSTQELSIYRESNVEERTSPDSDYVLDLAVEKVLIRRAEPLMLQLDHFRRVVMGLEEVVVTGEQAVKALDLVWDIQRQL